MLINRLVAWRLDSDWEIERSGRRQLFIGYMVIYWCVWFEE